MIRDERNILQCSSTLLALADANDVISAESSLLAHASEDGVGLVEQDERVADLDDFSSVHDDDPVVKGDGGEPTGQGEQSDQSEIDYKKMRKVTHCAIHKSVLSLSSSLIVSWISPSVSTSTEDVASSRRMTLEFRTTTLASASNCKGRNDEGQ